MLPCHQNCVRRPSDKRFVNASTRALSGSAWPSGRQRRWRSDHRMGHRPRGWFADDPRYQRYRPRSWQKRIAGITDWGTIAPDSSRCVTCHSSNICATRARSGPVRFDPHWNGWSYMLSRRARVTVALRPHRAWPDHLRGQRIQPSRT